MFTICHSNHLDLLEKLAAQIIKENPLPSVFASETIVVQSQGMAKWLQVQLANDLNIAANLSFLFPGQFIWKTYHHTLSDIPEKSAFERDVLIWKLLYLLPDIVTFPEFSLLKHYLTGEGQTQKYYSLAKHIADLYDSYLVYRPEWIMAWEQGELIDCSDANEIWQAKLWCAIKDHTQSLSQSTLHRAAIYQQFLTHLEQGALLPEIRDRLPKRVFIFGIASLPPTILTTLASLGKHIDIYLMLTNPCRWYWGDIPDKKWLNKLAQKRWQHQLTHSTRSFLKSIPYSDTKGEFDSHPLLALLGKSGRDNLFLLQEYEHKNDIEMFTDIDVNTVLQQVQQHILDLDNKAMLGTDVASFDTSQAKIVVDENDFSISFHSCHSVLREVDILYNDLLNKFDADPTLSLRDIIVMVPDIDVYAPAIKTIFGSAPVHRYLPFSLCDRKAQHVDPSIRAFLSLLSLPSCRFTTEDVFELLSVPAVATRFGLTEPDLNRLKEWCKEAGIRWGLDDAMLNRFGMQEGNKFTWQFGLERLLLGSIMQEANSYWRGIVPFEGSAGLAGERVGKLASFIEKLKYWSVRLDEQQSLPMWQNIGIQLINDFFDRNIETEPMLTLLEKEWQTLLNDGIASGYTKLISLSVLEQAMQSRLKRTRLEQCFLTGKINFCTLLPMRGIPFRVVCLLGMNDGAYPRLETKPSFDLIGKRPQRGDRSRREDDHYLFLEALMSAESHLYVSYIGKDIVDNHPHYPSVLVDALREYLGQTFVLEKDRRVNIDTSAERFKTHLTVEHPRTPYHPDNYEVDPQRNRTGSYMEEWYSAAQQVGEPIPFKSILPEWEMTNLSIEDLKRFYRHSIKSLLQKRLGVFYSAEETALPTSEYFTLEGLTRFNINQRILDEVLRTSSVTQDKTRQFVAEGKLPYGAFGELDLQDEQQKMIQLAERINADRKESVNQEVRLSINEIQLEGWIGDIDREGIVRAKPGNLTAADGIALWIDHVILTLLKPDLNLFSRLYGVNESAWCFTALSKHEAEQIASVLVEGYIKGMNAPLLLPIKSAWEWLKQCYDPDSQDINKSETGRKKARLQLARGWLTSVHTRSECDAYYRRLVPELTDSLLDQIEENAITFLLPMRRAWSN